MYRAVRAGFAGVETEARFWKSGTLRWHLAKPAGCWCLWSTPVLASAKSQRISSFMDFFKLIS
jgi:hypothetical protein